MRNILFPLFLMSSVAEAQGLRPDDRVFSVDELRQRLSGISVEFFDDSRASYMADGRYAYTYQPDDPPFVGTWDVVENSQVCVTFDNGFARCDTFVESRDRLTLIVENGDRYPVRTEAAIE